MWAACCPCHEGREPRRPVRHLSEQSTPRHRASSPVEPKLPAGILDLATRKTCGTPYRCGVRWALTPPFHPCRRPEGRLGGCFLSRYSTVADSSPRGVRCSLLPGLSSSASLRTEATDPPSRCFYMILSVSADDASLGIAYEKDYLVALPGGGQLSLDALYGIADVEA